MATEKPLTMHFEHACKVLAEVWSNMSIDGHPVVAAFFSDEANEPVVSNSDKWKAIHIKGIPIPALDSKI